MANNPKPDAGPEPVDVVDRNRDLSELKPLSLEGAPIRPLVTKSSLSAKPALPFQAAQAPLP